MPKITVHGGPSFADESPPSETNPPEPPDATPPGDPNPVERESPGPSPSDDERESPVGSDLVIVGPKRNASKDEWVKFATAQGVEEANQFTRDELASWWYDRD